MFYEVLTYSGAESWQMGLCKFGALISKTQNPHLPGIGKNQQLKLKHLHWSYRYSVFLMKKIEGSFSIKRLVRVWKRGSDRNHSTQTGRWKKSKTVWKTIHAERTGSIVKVGLDFQIHDVAVPMRRRGSRDWVRIFKITFQTCCRRESTKNMGFLGVCIVIRTFDQIHK